MPKKSKKEEKKTSILKHITIDSVIGVTVGISMGSLLAFLDEGSHTISSQEDKAYLSPLIAGLVVDFKHFGLGKMYGDSWRVFTIGLFAITYGAMSYPCYNFGYSATKTMMHLLK